MILRWRISNFKSVKGPASLDLAPVTILSGLNSAGKSTVLQSLLVICQTLRNQSGERLLVLNGPDVQLGSFSSVRNKRSNENEFSIGFDVVVNGFELGASEDALDPFESVELYESEDFEPLLLNFSCNVTFAQAQFTPSGRLSSANIFLDQAEYNVESSAPIQSLVNLEYRIDDYAGSNEASVEDFEDGEGPPVYSARIAVDSGNRDQLSELTDRLASEEQAKLAARRGLSYMALASSTNSAPSARDESVLLLNHFLPRAILTSYNMRDKRIRDIIFPLRFAVTHPELLTGSDNPFIDLRLVSQIRGLQVNDGLVREITYLLKSQFPYVELQFESLIDLMFEISRILPKQDTSEEIRDLRLSISLILAAFIIDSIELPEDSVGLEPLTGNQAAEAVILASTRATEYFVRSVRYLGPLRLNPKAPQSFSSSGELDDVGSQGEYAASVYETNRTRKISWWNPQTQNVETSALATAVGKWLQYLGIAESVTVLEDVSTGFSWRVRMVGDPARRPLSSVGVGVSQVLPILIAGLLLPAGGLLLLEQPELHLHPSAQSRLADFFVGMALTGRRCLVETHSEALISKFRLAFATSDFLTEDTVAIYFAKLEQGETKFEPVRIDSYGRIRNWPVGFFDENLLLQDEITEMAITKRMQG